MTKRPKAPAKTAEQVATERRLQVGLDKEIEEQEERFKSLARNRLGRQSLLSGAPRTPELAATAAGRGGGASLIRGIGGDTGRATPSTRAPTPRTIRTIRTAGK